LRLEREERGVDSEFSDRNEYVVNKEIL